MRVMVTGAAGFIGSNLVDRLLSRGDAVVGVDCFDPFYDPAIKERNVAAALRSDAFTLRRADITDAAALERVFDAHPVDVVVHLAAKAGVRPSIEDPQAYFRTNVTGTLHVLEAMRARGLSRLVYASSSSVYGNNEDVPFSESQRVVHPVSPYAATKLSNELMVHTYHHLFGLQAFGLRFFTVYGRRGRPEMAIHKFTRMIDRGETLPVYGNGEPRRDYTYIDDILQGVEAAIERVEGHEVYNLGESATTSVTRLIDLIESALGKKAVRELLPMQPGDVNETYADIGKARRDLGYAPTTPIEDGIERFVDWYRAEQAGE